MFTQLKIVNSRSAS